MNKKAKAGEEVNEEAKARDTIRGTIQRIIFNRVLEGTLTALDKDTLSVVNATKENAARLAIECIHVRQDARRLEATDGRQLIRRILKQSCALVTLPENGILLGRKDVKCLRAEMKKNEGWIIGDYHKNSGPDTVTLYKIRMEPPVQGEIIAATKVVCCGEGKFPHTDEIFPAEDAAVFTIAFNPERLADLLTTMNKQEQSDGCESPRVVMCFYEREKAVLVTSTTARAVIMPLLTKPQESK